VKRAAESEAEPLFLRPDATLAVVLLSDEVDCSAPSDNPRASRRAICKYGPVDNNADGVPDGYAAPDGCDEADARTCVTRDCANLTPEQCYPARCVIERSDNNNCEWLGQALTPVSDYADFLRSLKSAPERGLVVSASGRASAAPASTARRRVGCRSPAASRAHARPPRSARSQATTAPASG